MNTSDFSLIVIRNDSEEYEVLTDSIPVSTLDFVLFTYGAQSVILQRYNSCWKVEVGATEEISAKELSSKSSLFTYFSDALGIFLFQCTKVLEGCLEQVKVS